MGLWAGLLEDLIELKRRGLIGRGGRVAEIGEQQLSDNFLAADHLLAEVYRLFEAPRIPLGVPVGAENFADHAPPSRAFWRSLGFEYLAIDWDGKEAIKLDLNREPVPQGLRQSQDIVINAGTSEHVANQDHVFRFVHDLTKTNGMMIHAVPCQGLMTHGLFNYTLKFFWHLCRENDYEALSLRLGFLPEKPIDRSVIEFGVRFGEPAPLLAPSTIRDAYIVAILRKRHERDFVTPKG